MKNAYDKIDEEETKEGIEKIKDILLTNIQKENINKKNTINLFRSILSSTYYGQASFLQKTRASMTYEEQRNFMYRDYVSNIIETGFIHDILEEKYSIEEIKKYIENKEKEGKITKEIEKIYKKIKKDYIEKGKRLEEIKEYLKEKVIKRCCMCENEFGITTNYSEGNFVPLAISSDNARNFFWNQNVKFPICDICKLILFCIPAGTTNITKTIKENGKYKEKQLLNFVNYDTSVDTLLKTNNAFSNSSKYDNRTENPYTKLILNIIEQDKKISKWQLDNIFVVEFEAEYGAYSRMEYFNIKRYVAEFFTRYSSKTLSRIKDYRYKLQIIDYILKNKDIKYVINERLRDELKEDNPNGDDSFLATKTRMILNLLRSKGVTMNEINEKDTNLNKIYNAGVTIHQTLKNSNQENKLEGYIYKILNSIKSGNRKEFMDIIIRMHISIGKEVPPLFIEVMQETGLDFESIGYSFSTGLTSNYYKKEKEEN